MKITDSASPQLQACMIYNSKQSTDVMHYIIITFPSSFNRIISIVEPKIHIYYIVLE